MNPNGSVGNTKPAAADRSPTAARNRGLMFRGPVRWPSSYLANFWNLMRCGMRDSAPSRRFLSSS